MRHRTKSSSKPPVNAVQVNYIAYGDCTNPFYYQFGTQDVVSYVPWEESVVMDDIVTENWYRRRNSGEIINNPYQKTTTTWERSPINYYRVGVRFSPITCGGVQVWVPYQGGKEEGQKSPGYLGTSFLSPPASPRQGVIDQAVTNSWAKANESDAQGLVILAEGKKTIHSLLSIGGRLVRICKAIKKMRLQQVAKEFSCKELQNRWMEGRYAIRPVVYDALDCVKAINRDRTLEKFRQTYRGGASDSSTASSSGNVVWNYDVYGYITATKYSTVTVSARAGVLAALSAISEATIWGLDRPFDAMWELVPFSFVVDWFFNVGKVISAWSPAMGVQALTSWCVVDTTTSQSIVTESGHLGTWNPGGVYIAEFTASGGHVRKDVTTRERLVNPTRQVLPTFSVRLDSAKLLDLAIMGRRFLR